MHLCHLKCNGSDKYQPSTTKFNWKYVFHIWFPSIPSSKLKWQIPSRGTPVRLARDTEMLLGLISAAKFQNVLQNCSKIDYTDKLN